MPVQQEQVAEGSRFGERSEWFGEVLLGIFDVGEADAAYSGLEGVAKGLAGTELAADGLELLLHVVVFLVGGAVAAEGEVEGTEQSEAHAVAFGEFLSQFLLEAVEHGAEVGAGERGTVGHGLGDVVERDGIGSERGGVVSHFLREGVLSGDNFVVKHVSKLF